MNNRFFQHNVLFVLLVFGLGACQEDNFDLGDMPNSIFGDGLGDVYQAEDYSARSGCSEKTNHAGFTGSGFMDFGGNGTWIEWNDVDVAAAGEYTLTFRYANGRSTGRRSAAIVNGQNRGNVAFAGTGSWKTWAADSITVSLRKGDNTIRIQANTGSGGPNLDAMEVSGDDLCPDDPNKTEPGDCGCGVPEGECGVVAGNGLSGTYFNNMDLTGQVLTRVDPKVDFNWGSGSPDAKIDSNTFSVRWTGFVEAKYSETYTFHTSSDDGIRLWVDGELIIENWTNHPPTENQGTISLKAGKRYPVKMEYYENGGGAVAKLLWSSSKQGKQVIPRASLFTDSVGEALCVEAPERKSATLSCPGDEVIDTIDFASYGTPTGTCDTGFALSSCHAASAMTKLEDACLDKKTCTVAASNGVFGDPCPGTFKRLAVLFTCTGDLIDNCPDDPNKTEPGECGCGVPEGSCNGCTNTMVAGDKILSGEQICSQNGEYEFGLTSAGKLALWSDTETLWSGGTFGSSVHLIMQGDGNLVVYNGSQARWSSKTHGNPGATLKLENDGTVVIRLGTKVLWSKGGEGPVDLCPGDPNKTEPGKCGCGVPEGTCNEEDPWVFVVVGDSRGSNNGVNTSVWGHMVDAIIDEDPEFVLFPGDLTTSGTNSQFRQWIDTSQPLYDANIDVYPVRGNHDDSSLSAWNNTFSGSYRLPQNGPSGEKNLTYAVTHNNAFIAAIDNYSGSREVNQSWLDTKLAANSEPHVFVFGHEPAFAADHSDCLDDHSSARDDFWESLQDAGGRTYFAGHDHFYNHARIDDRNGNSNDDIHQFIVGSAGAPLYGFDGNYGGNNGNYRPRQEYHAKQYGYVVVVVDGNDVHLTFMQRSGSSYTEKDWFDYTVGGN